MEHQRSDVFTKGTHTSKVSSQKPVLPLFDDDLGMDELLGLESSTDSSKDKIPIHPASGYGMKINIDGSTYTGGFQNSKFHGNGTLEFADGCVFIGLFKEGRIVRGNGKYLYTNGDVFEGGMVNNRKHGKGTLWTPDGTMYQGTWLGDRMYGECTVRYSNGETFQGIHRVQAPDQGYGWTVTPEGMLYEGEWLNNIYHGWGTLYTADGCVLKGWWKEGQMHGRGEYIDNEGTLVTGTWTHGVLKAHKQRHLHQNITHPADSAYEEINYPDGTKYVGQMKKRRRHGQGTLTYRSGSSYQGEFVDGAVHGYGVMTYSPRAEGRLNSKGKGGFIRQAEVYKGQFQHGKRHGEGQLISSTGEVFTGVFRQNSIVSGSGTVTYPFGRSYKGSYSSGMRHGPGKITEADGSSLEINFANNKPHGEGVFTNRHGEVIYQLWDIGQLIKQTTEKPSASLNTDAKDESSGETIVAAGSIVVGDYVDASTTSLFGDTVITTDIDDAQDGSSTTTTTAAATATAATAFSERTFQAEIVTLHFEDDSTYTGHCIKGVPNGEGRIKYVDGSHYSGFFARGLKHGQGKHFYKHINCTYEGHWEKGNRHGEGTLTYHNTDETFTGEFKYGRIISGMGVYYSRKKVRFEGEFAYGYLVQGKIKYQDGSVYEGELCDGLQHGQGTLTDKDGVVVYSGLWEEGERIEG